MIKAIIFDLDDTLYPEREFVESGFKTVAKYLSKKHGLDCSKVLNILKSDFKKGLRKKNFNILLEKLNLHNESTQRLVKVYRNHYPISISLYPDAEKTLKEAKKIFKIGLITDGREKTQKNKISALKVGNYLDEILILGNLSEDYWKPSKRPFELLLKKFQIKPEEAIYVGDNPLKDFAPAKKLGIFTIQIKRKKGEYGQIDVGEEYKADYKISNLFELKKIIKKINKHNNKKINVLIVPAGSGMAIAAIKALKQDKDIKVISADTNNLAPGLYLSQKGYIIPSFKSKTFYPKLKKIILKEKIDTIIPALDTILLDFSKLKSRFKKMEVEVLVSEYKTIKITRDKWKTYNELKDVIHLPKSFIKKEHVNIAYPFIIKPRGGSGSQNVYKINSKEELEFYFNRIKKPIIQEYLEGKEYTVDCLADKNCNLILSIPRERIETKAGISIKGKTVKNKKLEDMAKKISTRLKFYGPFFFQVKEDEKGIPKLTEINARIAGTMCLSSFSGANLHSLAVRLSLGEKIKIPKIKYGLYTTRFWEEIYLNSKDILK